MRPVSVIPTPKAIRHWVDERDGFVGVLDGDKRVVVAKADAAAIAHRSFAQACGSLGAKARRVLLGQPWTDPDGPAAA